MKVLYGKPLADRILRDIRKKVEQLERKPVLMVVTDHRRQPYYKGIIKDAAYCGIDIVTCDVLNDGNHQTRLMNEQKDVDGVISLVDHIRPFYKQDVDGREVMPCTAEAVMELLNYYNIPVAGKNVCIIGRSPRVGRPLVDEMISRDATVTCCHSKTRDLFWQLSGKDIVISCVGNARFTFDEHWNQYMTVFDIGDDLGKVEGVAAYCPFVGGVGPVTRAVLMRHAYLKCVGKEK